MKTTFYTIQYTNFAQAYGENAYGECTYNDTTSCTTSGGGSTGGGGSANGGAPGTSSGLENTGLLIAVIVTLACIIAMVAIIVRVMRRSNKKPALEAVATDDRRQQ